MDELDAIYWLIAGNVIVWLSLGAYVAFLASKQRALAIRLKQFETLRADHDISA